MYFHFQIHHSPPEKSRCSSHRLFMRPWGTGVGLSHSCFCCEDEKLWWSHWPGDSQFVPPRVPLTNDSLGEAFHPFISGIWVFIPPRRVKAPWQSLTHGSRQLNYLKTMTISSGWSKLFFDNVTNFQWDFLWCFHRNNWRKGLIVKA